MRTLYFLNAIVIAALMLLLTACVSSNGEDEDSKNDKAPAFISAASPTLTENTVIAIKVEVSEMAGDISFAITGGADQALFRIDADNGTLNFTTPPDFENPADDGSDNVYEVIVTASNGTDTIQQTLNISITATNEAPLINSPNTISIFENSTEILTINSIDPENSALSFAIIPGHDGILFSIHAVTGALVFSNAADYEQPLDGDADNVYEVLLSVSDGVNETEHALTVIVVGVNEFSPTIPEKNLTLSENSQLSAAIGFDRDNDPLTFALVGGADQSLFSINATTGILVFKAPPDFENPNDNNADNSYEVIITVSDGVNEVQETLTITVNAVDEAPIFSSSNIISIEENNTSVLTLVATDPEGNATTFNIEDSDDKTRFNLDAVTGVLTFLAAPDFETPLDSNADNTYTIIVSASDSLLTTQQTLFINVEGVNDIAPSITSPATISVFENSSRAIAVIGHDPDGDVLEYSIVGGEDQDKFSIDTLSGALVFNDTPDFEAYDSNDSDNEYLVEVKITDGLHPISKSLIITVLDDPEQLDVVSGGIKTLSFSWPVIVGATHYKLLNNPDGVSGFSQVGSDITSLSIDITVPVHLTDWVNASYIVESYDDIGLLTTSPEVSIASLMLESIGYGKASDPELGATFGHSVAISGDGSTLAVGAIYVTERAGAVYIFTHEEGVWSQQAYITASNSNAGDRLGYSLSLSDDGNILAVAALSEDSAASGVNSEGEGNNDSPGAGAVYLYLRTDSTWRQTDYIKASNSGEGDGFGYSLSLSSSGNTLAVSALGESSCTVGINGEQIDDGCIRSGAVYVFNKVGETWQQQAYIKASNAEENDRFGWQIHLSEDGDTMVVSTIYERGGTGEQSDNSADFAGAVYVFVRLDNGWRQQAYLKSSNLDANDRFGYSVAISADGHTIAVGAPLEDSSSTDVDGDSSNNGLEDSGAAYLFTRNGDAWVQVTYIKAQITTTFDRFGERVALSGDGNILAVAAQWEDSRSTGVNSSPEDVLGGDFGAVFMFSQSDSIWRQSHYVKASNSGPFDAFGADLDLSDDGSTLVVGATEEDGNSQGFTGDQSDNSLDNAGAVYIY